MKRRLLAGWFVFALALLGTVVLAQSRKNRPTAFFAFNASGGDLCDFTTDTTFFSGSWWCVKPDGTNASGAIQTLSCSGTCTTENALLYPAGLDRGPGLQQRMGTTSSRFQTSVTLTGPTGDFSTCAVSNRDAFAGSVDPIGHDNVSGGYLGLDWAASATTANAIMFNAAAQSTTISYGTVSLRAYHLFCATYHRVADGTSRFTAYLDGSQAAQSTTAKLFDATVSRRWTLGGLDYGTFSINGAVRGGFMTEVELTAAQIAQLARHVLGSAGQLVSLDLNQQRTTYETSLTASRSSLASAIFGGYVLRYSANTPRVGPTGLYSDGAATNLALRSEEFDNATWSKSANTTGVADQTAAPDGQTTADALSENSVANAAYQLSQAITVSASTTYIASVFVKRSPNGATQFFIPECDGNSSGAHFASFDVGTGQYSGTSAGSTTALPTLSLANGWYRVAVRFATNGGDNTATCYLGFGGSSGSYLHVGANGVAGYLWGAQLEAVTDGTTPTAPTSYIPTTTTSVARSTDGFDWTPPSGSISATEGCMRFCTLAVGSADTRNVVANRSATANRLGYFSGSSYLAYDGTHNPSVAANESAGQVKCFKTTWSASGNALTVYNLTDGTSASTAFTAFADLSSLTFGTASYASQRASYSSGIQFGTAATDCN